jgi:PAS domain-containing protein
MADTQVACDQAEVAATIERAHEAVAEAREALRKCQSELMRLQRLSEQLLELGPPAVVLDEEQRVRGMSAAAERLLGVQAIRTLGRSASSVLPHVDLTQPGQRTQIVDGPPGHGHLRVRVRELGDDTLDRLVVLEPEENSTVS